MRGASTHLDGFTQLHRLPDREARVSVWRQSVAALAAEAVDLRPVPLEGVDPVALAASIRAALAQGLVDDLGWLSPPHAAAALYELASALPIGDERRELGRRVLLRLNEGNAETFVTLAAQLAMGSRRGLAGSSMRARVALALALPISAGGRADALALALISRADLAREWLSVPSTGALPSRRLAARLLERAAREAVRRRVRHDDTVLAIFEQPSVLAAWNRLLADRESLVWRHVAAARGLLSGVMPHFAERIEEGLDPGQSPTEWRRGAASLAARIAVDPDGGLVRSFDLLRSEVLQRDPGIAAAMVLGLARTAEAEPQAAEQLLGMLVKIGNLDTIESLVELEHELLGAQVGDAAARAAQSRLDQPHFARSDDDGRVALLRALHSDLTPDDVRKPRAGLPTALSRALRAFADRDARAAHAQALGLLSAVESTLDDLEASSEDSSGGRQQSFLALRELDRALLETSTLTDLLMLGSPSGDVSALRTVHGFHERLAGWLVRRERHAIDDGATLEHVTLRARRLRTLLHLVDADGGVGDDRSMQSRERRLRTTSLLLKRARDDAPSPLRRVVCAAAARACDALLREEVAELSDLLIAVALHIRDAEDLMTIAEASMDPVAEAVFRTHANLVRQTAKASQMTGQRGRVGLESLGLLIRALPAVTSPRVDALRQALLQFSDAVQTVLAADSLVDLCVEEDGDVSRMGAFADGVSLLSRLIVGARRRLGDPVPGNIGAADAALRSVDVGLAQSVRESSDALQAAVEDATRTLREELPGVWADIAADALYHLSRLPVVSPPAAGRISVVPKPLRESPLPPWLPPSRVIGGFHVIRTLGTGSVGSVFSACRADEKGLRHAMRFALKVPEYGGDVARSLSEAEFLRLFREEAGALLAVPEHPNLARLVTFDAGARPKPILVMELVEGPTLQRLLDTAALDLPSAFTLLDGVAAGLEAMHAAGVGHLDVKPSNVILRDPDHLPPASMDFGSPSIVPRASQVPGKATGIPVLVDFGLAGRKVRPGCATAHYGAPEVWGHVPEGVEPRPVAVDTYAFGCLVFETLTRRELFDAPSQLGVISSHLLHDGDSPPLLALGARKELAPVVEMICGAVRRDPRDRMSLPQIRKGLRQAAAALASFSWPLA